MSVARRVVLSAVLSVLAIAPATAVADHHAARHSLRAPVTDQNFYFVMPDRFENAVAANDNGGLHPEIWLKQGDPAVYFSPPAP